MTAHIAKHVSKKLGIEALAARFDALEAEVRNLRAALLFEISRNKDLSGEVRASAEHELLTQHDLKNKLAEQKKRKTRAKTYGTE